MSYANSFNFNAHIRYRHRVVSVELRCKTSSEMIEESRNKDSLVLEGNLEERESLLLRTSATTTMPGYKLTILNMETNETSVHVFAAVAICTGHNHTPRRPSELLTMASHFKGTTLHTHAFKRADMDKFMGKNVLVVGVGNSAGDVAAELAPIAKQVYMSSRRGGTWLVRRTGLSGYPVDTQAQTRLVEGALRVLPYPVRCWLVEAVIEKHVGHQLLGLRPKGTCYFGQHVMVNDLIPTAIHLGQIKMRGPVERFTEGGVVFKG